MKREFGLIGHPLGHSLSSRIHTALYRHYGIDAQYRHYDLLPEELADHIAAFRRGGAGFNVTTPYKQTILPFLDELRGDAKEVGAVNTVAVRDGALIGYSTDGAGLLRALKRRGFSPKGRRVVLLGAGGAAVSTARALLTDGVERLTVLNRTLSRAQAIADGAENAFADRLEHAPLYWRDCELLINATSVGMKRGECPVTVTEELCCPVVDMIYSPRETELLKQAGTHGCPTENGLGMLLYQAFCAFELWTGIFPDDTVFTRLLSEIQ